MKRLNKKALNFRILIVVIVLIILISLSVFLMVRKGGEEPLAEKVEIVEEEMVKELSIDNLVFASYIDEDYNYVVRGSNVYSVGDIVYVYFEVSGFGKVDEEIEKRMEAEIPDLDMQIGETSVIRYFEVVDPQGRIVSDLSEYGILFSEIVSDDIERIQIKHILTLGKGLIPGVYTINIGVFDWILDKTINRSITFIVK